MSIVETTEATYADDVAGPLPVLVDFWAPWCQPCLALAPHLERLSADYAGHLKIVKLNIDEAPSGWKHFGVRSIPALVFFVNGKEHSRLTGPSTMRLNITLARWFKECGLAAPVLPEDTQPPIDETVTTPQLSTQNWSSFAGDGALKAASLARLQHGPQARADNGRVWPSEWLAGGEDRFESVIGAPAQLGELIDMLVGLQRGTEASASGADALLKNIAAALPVGANLSRVAAEVLFSLVYESEWSLEKTFTGTETRTLFAAIKTQHQSERQYVPVAATVWTALQREAVLLGTTAGNDETSRTLEGLAEPLSQWNARQIFGAIFSFSTSDTQRYPAWSRQESERVREMYASEMKRIREELGPQPEDTADKAAWIAAAGGKRAAFDQHFREHHTELWQRYKAWQAFEQQLYVDFCADATQRLLAQLHSVTVQHG